MFLGRKCNCELIEAGLLKEVIISFIWVESQKINQLELLSVIPITTTPSVLDWFHPDIRVDFLPSNAIRPKSVPRMPTNPSEYPFPLFSLTSDRLSRSERSGIMQQLPTSVHHLLRLTCTHLQAHLDMEEKKSLKVGITYCYVVVGDTFGTFWEH